MTKAEAEKTKLDNIVKDGFSLPTKNTDEIELAFLSLWIALKAYFSTYQTIKGNLYFDAAHSRKYRETYAETIVHFQHFAELICVKFLKDTHPLLHLNITKKNREKFFKKSGKKDLDKDFHIDSYKHMKDKYPEKRKLTEEEEEEINTLNFSDMLKRLLELINANLLKDSSSLKFIIDHEESLKKLTKLRNNA